MGVASGLPLVPAASCSSPASALGAVGLGTVCQAASSAVGSAASNVVGLGANTVLDAMGSWVTGGAVWLLDQVGAVLGATTSIDLGASWFGAHYETMAALAGVVVVPLLLLGIVQSIYRQSASMLVRSVLLNVPLAILLTAIAVKLVQLGLTVTDDLSAAVAQGAGLDTGNFMASVVTDLDSGSGAGTPAFVVFLGGIVVVVGAVLVWIELLVRSAAVYVAVLFLPLALASLAWPAIAHWCRRLVDTLVALVLAKFVIVSVLSLAAGALAGGSAPGGGSPSGGGFAAVLGGAALLLLAAFAPFALLRLLPFVEAGAVGHLEGLGQRARRQAAPPARRMWQVAMAAPGERAMTAAMAAPGRAVAAQRGALAAMGGGAGAGAPGATGAGAGAGGGGGPDGGGPPSPLPGPSMAETTGVGATSVPGADIPFWEPHPGATAAAAGIPLGPSVTDVTAPRNENRADERRRDDELRPLPRQSAALVADSIGRDALGVKLVSRPLPPAERPEAGESAPDGPDGGRGGGGRGGSGRGAGG